MSVTSTAPSMPSFIQQISIQDAYHVPGMVLNLRNGNLYSLASPSHPAASVRRQVAGSSS